MAKGGSRKRKPAPMADHAPADLAMRPHEFETFTATDDRGRQLHAYRRRDRLTELHRSEIIDKRQLLALEAYRDAHQSAGRGNLRSCLDRTPPGDGPILGALIAAGKRVDALVACIPDTSRYAVNAIALGNRTVEDVAADYAPHSRGTRYIMGQRRTASAGLRKRVQGELIEGAECLAIVLRIGSEAA